MTQYVKPESSIQNYFQLLYMGLSLTECELITLSDRQISTKEMGVFRHSYRDKDEYCTYYYVPKLLIPGLSQMFAFLVNFLFAVKIIIKYKPDVMICDIMRFYISTPAKLVAKLFGIKCVAYAADLPQMYNHQSSHKSLRILGLIKAIYSLPAKSYDAYILLSRHMNELINPHDKPSVVIEGIVDSFNIKTMKQQMDPNRSKTIFMYSGGLHAKYGVRLLIDSVLASKQEIELWLFGKGDQEEYIKRINCDQIKFFGYQPRELVIEKQMEADFLINPRFSDEEYTKYSFPSKIMEYMASKVPVVTTLIQGMPNEYFNYLIVINDESIEGFGYVFDECIKMSQTERITLGAKAAEYVLTYKDSKTQGVNLKNWLVKILYNGKHNNKKTT